MKWTNYFYVKNILDRRINEYIAKWPQIIWLGMIFIHVVKGKIFRSNDRHEGHQ